MIVHLYPLCSDKPYLYSVIYQWLLKQKDLMKKQELYLVPKCDSLRMAPIGLYV